MIPLVFVKMQNSFNIRHQLNLEISAMNEWIITVLRPICQIRQNEILDVNGLYFTNIFLLQKGMLMMDTSVSPHGHVLTFLSAKCCLGGCLLLNAGALEGLFHLNVLLF